MGASVVLVGGGRMGGALLAGWLDGGALEAGAVAVVEPDAATAAALRRGRGAAVVDSPEALGAAAPELVLFAVKPQAIGAILPAYARFAAAAPPPVFLSIAAGVTLEALRGGLGAGAAVVRAMPNTPAAVGRGISVACPGPGVTPDMRALCGRLLEAVGEVAWIDDEALMDAVTAVSGSGPAYVFLLAECLADAGAAAGLDRPLAERLARATVAGSGALLDASEESAAELRRNVTSPGGTTAAALEVLAAEGGLAPLMAAAVRAAAARSRALAGARPQVQTPKALR